MIWLDFFLQVFVHALAWCFALIISLGLTGWGVWTLVLAAMGRGR